MILDKDENGFSRRIFEENLFKGNNFHSQSRGYGFLGNITLHNILQYDKEYSERPYDKLIKSLISHGIAIAENNNIYRILNWLEKSEIRDVIYKDLPNFPTDRIAMNCFKCGFREDYPRDSYYILGEIGIDDILLSLNNN